MAGTMCISGNVLVKAGPNVSTDLSESGTDITGQTADEILNEFINQAESTINAITRINYTDDYAGLNDDAKKILEDVCSSLAAMSAIQYDMSNYDTLREAETKLDVLRDSVTRGLSLLRDKKQTTFVDKA